MAKSKSFFGLRKGSTKSHTYSVLDGQQVTKDRVYDVKNPRTQGQMRQRMVMTTVGAAYKYLKAIADHSFEGKSAGMQCMRAFNSANLNRFKAGASLAGSIAYNEYKDGAINPLPFQLSEGSLPGFNFSFSEDGKLAINLSKENADLTTAEGIYSVLGVQRDDLITFCTVVGEKSLKNGIFDYKPSSFDIVRLRCDKSGAVASVSDAFTISTNGLNATVEFTTETNGIVIKSVVADFGAVIQSRKSNDAWLRSTTYMVVKDAVTAGVLTQNQLATYPVGTDLILNNGPMQNEGESGNSSLPLPNLVFAQNSVTCNGTSAVAAPALSGIPNGATVQYTTNNVAVVQVNPSTGLLTPVGNGTAVITARTSATDEYAAGVATFNVTVTGIAVSALAVSPSKWEWTGSAGTTITQEFTFSNPANEAVVVDMQGSTFTSTVASNKQSVTITGTSDDQKSANFIIKVGSKQASINFEFSTDM